MDKNSPPISVSLTADSSTCRAMDYRPDSPRSSKLLDRLSHFLGPRQVARGEVIKVGSKVTKTERAH